MQRLTIFLLVGALALPRPCRADDDEPRSLAMVDGGIAMIIFGAIGTALTTAVLPMILAAPSDGCCAGVRNENRGAFIGFTAGFFFSVANLIGGIPLVYFGAQHKGQPNAAITATGIVLHF